MRADYAFGMLKGETGNHRLIRISPFDSAGRRHTSFAAVDVTPAIDDETIIDVDFANEVREDIPIAPARRWPAREQDQRRPSASRTCRRMLSCNARTNAVSTKTGRLARKMLIAASSTSSTAKKGVRGSRPPRPGNPKIGFGGETIRNYVLHPDQFVKDTRTGQKSGNPTNVLNGELDPFIEEYLQLVDREGFKCTGVARRLAGQRSGISRFGFLRCVCFCLSVMLVVEQKIETRRWRKGLYFA